METDSKKGSLNGLIRDIRSVELWTPNALIEILKNYFPNKQLENAKLENFRKSHTSLINSKTHIGLSSSSFADIAKNVDNNIRLNTTEAISLTLMAIDWQLVGLDARLKALEQLNSPEKKGFEWLTALDGPMPSFFTLPTMDRLAFIVVRAVGKYFDVRDEFYLHQLAKGIRYTDKSSVAKAILGLTMSGAKRGVKLGCINPRLLLLRELAHETDSISAIIFSAQCLSELTMQYREYAEDQVKDCFCHQVALSFSFEALEKSNSNSPATTDQLEEIMKSAYHSGYSMQNLIPLWFAGDSGQVHI